jgi:hypothetical protein
MQSSEGGCLCGLVRYRITGEPSSSSLCHCFTCRRATGAPTVAWLTVERDQFAILLGSPRTFESSPGVLRRFCGGCGTALTYENTKNPLTIDITTLSLDDPNRFPPDDEVWLEHKVSWQITDASRGQYPGGTASGPADT